MCTNFSTRNRAVLLNNYTTTTLLVDRNAYCPCGPNTQDYTRRSRLYNPDPKYVCAADMTCHMYDSIPKDNSCGGYGPPQGQGSCGSCCGGPSGAPGTTIPCIAPFSGCYPPSNYDCTLPPEPSCVRRRIKPPSCCTTRPTYRDLIESMQCPCPPPMCCPPPCCPEEDEDDYDQNDDCGCNEDEEEEENNQNKSCYSLTVPPEFGDCCGSKVKYNFGPCGITRSVKTQGGQKVVMACQDEAVTLETFGGPGGCCIGNSGMRVQSQATPYSYCVSPQVCPPPQRQSQGYQLCCPPPCPRRCPPPPCRIRRRVRCSPFARTTVGPDIGCGCQSMEFRPPFRCP